jgi:hypothetical protein
MDMKEMVLDVYDEVSFRVRQALAASRRSAKALNDGVRGSVSPHHAPVAAAVVAVGAALWVWRAARRLRRITDEPQWEQALAKVMDR